MKVKQWIEEWQIPCATAGQPRDEPSLVIYAVSSAVPIASRDSGSCRPSEMDELSFGCLAF